MVPAPGKDPMAKALLFAMIGSACLWGQSQPAAPAAPVPDHASAYYHYTLAHMYAELAGTYRNRADYVNLAIENYKEAIKADPTASALSEELSDVYVQTGRLREGQADAEETLKKNPNDLTAHRLLARIYTRLIGDAQRVDEMMLKRAIDEYRKIGALAPGDTDAWLMVGRLEKAQGDSVEAEKAYQKVLAIDKTNEDALTGLALVYSDLGDNAKAAALLKTLTDSNPSARSLQALAAAYEQMRDFKGASQALRQELSLNPPNEKDVERALAQDLTLAMQYDDALNVYEDMAKDDPDDANAYLRMSQIYRERRDFPKAREAGDKAKAIEPNSIEIRYNEVSILEAEDRVPEAAQLLKDILTSTAKRGYTQGERASRVALLERLGALYRSVDQTDPAVDAYRQMADVDATLAARASAQIIDTYRAGKEFAKAQTEADASAKKWPDDRTLRVVRDTLLAEMGKVDEAASDLKKMFDGKTDRETYVSLADVYEKGRKWDDEAKALDSAERLSGNDDERINVWFMRGAMYERMNKVEKADTEFNKVLKADPDNANAMNYIGYMYADRNQKLEESLKLILAALEREPGNGAYLDSLGWVYYKLGRYDEAEKNLRRAVDKTPRDPTVHDHLAETLMKRGKVADAVDQWQISLREWGTSSPADMRPEEVAGVKKKLDNAKVRLASEKPPANKN
jgi:tetratricopeptide (TPR) repeat protein